MSKAILVVFLMNLVLVLGVDYCIDWQCPTECCVDIYTCSPYPKCEIPRLQLGTTCELHDDCESKCCNDNDVCAATKDCEGLSTTAIILICVLTPIGVAIFVIGFVYCIMKFNNKKTNTVKETNYNESESDNI